MGRDESVSHWDSAQRCVCARSGHGAPDSAPSANLLRIACRPLVPRVMQGPPLSSRLQVLEANLMSGYSSTELVTAMREKLTETCELEDRTRGLPTDGGNVMAIIKFLSDTVGDAEAAGGRKLIYVQRTAENKDGFCSTFALVKYGETVTQTTDPIRFAAPGWIAWCRDDYVRSHDCCSNHLHNPPLVVPCHRLSAHTCKPLCCASSSSRRRRTTSRSLAACFTALRRAHPSAAFA